MSQIRGFSNLRIKVGGESLGLVEEEELVNKVSLNISASWGGRTAVQAL